MSSLQIDTHPELKRAGRHLGYGIAVVFNVLILIVVQNALTWGWPAFLTTEFAEVVSWVSLSLVASIVVNLVYQFNDTPVVKSTGQITTNLITIVVTYHVLRVFPFDFSAYDFNWGIVVRVMLILGMVGAAIGMLVEVHKLASYEPDKERR